MSCRNLLGLPDRQPTFPDRLETEPGIPFIDPGGGGWFGRVAEQSPLTGYERNNLIEISSQHTPINFPSRRNSFSTDFNDVPTIAASDATDTLDAGMASPLFTQEREVNPLSASVHQQGTASGSSNPQQPASPNVTNPWQTSNVGSCGKLQRCAHVVRSCWKLQRSDCSDVENSVLSGKRDREFGSMSSQEQETFLSERQNLHDYLERETWRALQGEGMYNSEKTISGRNGEGVSFIWTWSLLPYSFKALVTASVALSRENMTMSGRRRTVYSEEMPSIVSLLEARRPGAQGGDVEDRGRQHFLRE